MNAHQNLIQIADQLERSCGYPPKQACEPALARCQGSHNAREVVPWVKREPEVLLNLQSSPEQIACKLPVSHDTLYLHVYAGKYKGGKLWKNLRCQK